jgi:hypothetical protein
MKAMTYRGPYQVRLSLWPSLERRCHLRVGVSPLDGSLFAIMTPNIRISSSSDSLIAFNSLKDGMLTIKRETLLPFSIGKMENVYSLKQIIHNQITTIMKKLFLKLLAASFMAFSALACGTQTNDREDRLNDGYDDSFKDGQNQRYLEHDSLRNDSLSRDSVSQDTLTPVRPAH